MYIFFASTGAVSQIVIDDEDLHQGDVNVNHVYAFFASHPNLSYTGTVTFERPDGEVSPERTMTPTTFTYDSVSYAGYHFLIDDEWILAVHGELKTTVRVRSGAGAVLAGGLITAPIEQTVYDDEPTVTVTQYNDLQAGLAGKADKSQTILHVATYDDIPTLDGGAYDGYMFILDDGTIYRIDTDTATFIGIIGKNALYVKSSVILAKGDVVQFQNATGGFVQVKKMTPSEVNVYPQLVLGFAMQAFTANGWGIILLLGKLEGVDTSSGTDGVYVYANTTSGTGLWTVTRPTAPNAIIVLGTISNAGVNGTIDVRLSIIPKLSQLSDVYDPVLAQDDVLKWNGSTLRWEVTKEMSVYKYLGTYATVALAVTAISGGSTGVLYEFLVNGIPYEGIKTAGGVYVINLGSNSTTYYVSDTIQQIQRSIYYYNGTLIDSLANTVPEVYRNSFRSLMSSSSIGTCIVTKGQYGGTATTEYAYVFFVSATVALITVGARTWKYDYTADTFTEYYLTKTDAQSTYVALTQKGAANGVAPLGADSKIASTYLPAYVDDVVEYANFASFPVTGSSGIIYVALDTNKTYRWSGSAYTEISPSLALGETDSTAYRGDRGKIAYEHSQLEDGSNPHATTFANIVSKPTTMSGYGITDGVRVLTDMSTPLNTAYATFGRQIAINGANDSYVLILFPDVASPTTWNGRFYCGSSRIGVRAFRQMANDATIQDAFNDSVASAKQDCYELITGSDFASLIGVTSLYNQGLYEIKDSSSATYKYGSRYSLSYTGVATLLALPDAIVSGLDAKAGKFYAINLLSNSNFALSDVGGWVTSNCTISVVSGKLTATSSAAGIYQVYKLFTFVNNHVYYYAIKYTSSTAVTAGLYMTNGVVALQLDTSASAAGTRISKSGMMSTTYNVGIFFRFGTAAAAGEIGTIDDIVVLDLTATFGAGKEPTAKQMDDLLARNFTNSWFDAVATELSTIQDLSGTKMTKIYTTNKVSNGNMVGTTNYSIENGTLSASSNVLSATASNGAKYCNFRNLSTTNGGARIYIAGQLRVTNSDASFIKLTLENSSTNTGIGNGIIQNTPTINQWYSLSVITDVASSVASVRARGTHEYIDTTTANGKVMEAKYLIVIDLTSTFGAGNEPTKEFMDYLMTLKYGTNAWFDGTSEIFNLADAIRLFASTQQEAWITPTLINGATNFDAVNGPIGYYKDSSGRVWLRGLLAGMTTNNTAFVLPVGYRPKYPHYLTTRDSSNNIKVGYVTGGAVYIFATTYISYILLDGLSFRAEQ